MFDVWYHPSTADRDQLSDCRYYGKGMIPCQVVKRIGIQHRGAGGKTARQTRSVDHLRRSNSSSAKERSPTLKGTVWFVFMAAFPNNGFSKTASANFIRYLISTSHTE